MIEAAVHFKVHRLTLAVASALMLSASPTVLAQDVDQSVQKLQSVVVTAAGHEQEIIDAPASISVVTREELEKKSYRDVIDAVKDIPGVYVTGGAGTQDISIRGMSSSYTLYLVDGRPVSAGRSVNTNGQDSGKQIGLPPLSMIERIEVIRGPMSSLYGSEAMGGVINIITRKVTDAWGSTASVEYTKSANDISNDGQNANFFVGGPLIQDRLGLKINGAYSGNDESDFQGGGDSAASWPETKRRSGGAELVFTPNKANTFTLGAQASKQETVTTPGKSVPLVASNGQPNTGGSYDYKKNVYTLTHEGQYGDLWTNSYLQHDISEKIQDLRKKEKITVLNTQGNYLLGAGHMLTFGAQYKYEDFTNETNGLLSANVPGAVANVNRWIGAVFAEAEWALRDDFTLTTGLRYNQDELFGGHLSPRLYGVYHHSPRLSFKGGVSTGYKQPSLTQATEGFGATTGGGGSPAPHSRAINIGNPSLEPETSTSYELGFAFNDPDMGLNSSVMLFHTQYKDKIAEDRYCESPNADRQDPSTWSCPFGQNTYLFVGTYRNISKAMMQGVEASFDYRLLPTVGLNTSYTFTRSEQQSGEFKGRPLNKIPKHMLNVRLDWDATHNLNLWAQGSVRGKTSDYMGRTSMSSGTPGYALYDLGMVYQVNKHAKLKAGIYNVTNKKITNDTYGVVLDGRKIMAGLTVDF